MLRQPLSAILHRYPAPLRDLEPVAPGVAGGFSGAEIVRLRGPGGDYCLRGWPAPSLPRPRILGLHRLLQQVFTAGVRQVPVPLPASDGTTLVVSGGRDWQIEPWMPGRADFHARPAEGRLRAAMACVAAWHAAAARFVPRHDEREWFASGVGPSPAVRERLDLLLSWSAPRLHLLRERIECEKGVRPLSVRGSDPFFAPDRLQAESGPSPHSLARKLLEGVLRAAPRVEADLRAARMLEFPLQPCLRDVWHDHVLFTGGDVTGLIDCSACRTENVAADLARLLGSLLADDTSMWDAALGEYGKYRPLSVNELGLVPVLDRSGVLLSALTWLDRLYVQQHVQAPAERVFQRMRWIAQRL